MSPWIQAAARAVQELEQAAQVQAQPRHRAPPQVGAVAPWYNRPQWCWPMVKSTCRATSTMMQGASPPMVALI